MSVRHRVRVPELGDSVEHIVVVAWQVSVGQTVAEGDPLVIVETDKVDTEIPSPVGGIVIETLVPTEAEVAVGDPICVIEE